MSPRQLKILYVSYPLLRVNEESAGGAEQMLSVLERQMAARGHATTVAACEGSRVAGELFATGTECREPDQFEARNSEHAAAVVEHIWRRHGDGSGYDLVHDKSGHFWTHASALPVPVLATMHLPRHFYREDMVACSSPNLFFNCVSESQRRMFADLSNLMPIIQNGIPVERFPLEFHKRDYVLWIGRICEEKGTHVAIDVAQRVGVPLVLAGQVYPFSYHQEYFRREIASRLESAQTPLTFVEKPSLTAKVELLQRARALLVPTLVDETSSLVAMEAMSCGTPVVAFKRGAIPEVVSDGETGFVVGDQDDMVAALARVGEISPESCRARVEQRFSAERMTEKYEKLYMEVLQRATASAGSEILRAA